MTDFKAPPVPPLPHNDVPENGAADAVQEMPAPVSSQEQETGASEQASDAFQTNIQKLKDKTDELQQKFSALPDSKRNLLIYLGVFVAGLFLGWLFFGGTPDCKQKTATPQDLPGKVANPDIKEKLKRCGLVSPSSPCVLYVMNHYNYEKLAKDFFETAVAVTGRPKYLIGSENVRYGSMHIPPGYFAEIKIPMQR